MKSVRRKLLMKTLAMGLNGPNNCSRGSFTVQLFEGLRLISLNTGYCETTNLLVKRLHFIFDKRLTFQIRTYFIQQFA